MGAVLASSMCAIGDSLFFLGSRLGDSMLVSYRRGTASDEKPAETELEVRCTSESCSLASCQADAGLQTSMLSICIFKTWLPL